MSALSLRSFASVASVSFVLLAGCGNPSGGGGTGPIFDPCLLPNPPASCNPPPPIPIPKDPCIAPGYGPDWNFAVPDGTWDPDYQPGGNAGGLMIPQELGQVLFPSVSGFYGYRKECPRWVVDITVPALSHLNDAEGKDSLDWNAGAWDLPSSAVNEEIFPPQPGGSVWQPWKGFGDADQAGLSGQGSSSVPNNPTDCARYEELVNVYKAPRPDYFQLPTQWTHVYGAITQGEWVVDAQHPEGICAHKCVSSNFPNCTGAPSMTYPNSDNNEIAETYRFTMGTKLRTSWQQTALTVWESEAGGT